MPPAIPVSSSTFTFTTLALPSYSLATSSSTGPTIRHGPHHGAQKSTRTGTSLLTTSSSKFASVPAIASLMAPSLTSPAHMASLL
jgi:hypothetical protein